MSNNTHTITITLSPEAQRAALLAGEPAQREQVYEVPSELLRELLELPWTSVSAEGVARCVVPPRLCYYSSEVEQEVGTPVTPLRSTGGDCVSVEASRRPGDAAAAIAFARSLPEAFQRAVDAERVRFRKAEKEKAAKERAIAEEWAALPLEWRATAEGVGVCVPYEAGADYRGPLRRYGKTRYEIAHLRTYVPEAYAAAEALSAQLRKEADEAEARAEAARRELVGRLIDRYGDDSQRERFAAGLLPSAEADAVITDGVLSPLREFAAHERITSDDLEGEGEDSALCSHVELTCRKGAANALSAEAFERLKAIRVAAKRAAEAVAGHLVVEPRYVRCVCDHCSASAERYSVLVRIAFGGLAVSREFAL